MCTHAAPPMLYDYSGFPPESYEIQYPAPGPSEELVRRVKQLLNDGGMPAKENSKRGFGEWLAHPCPCGQAHLGQAGPCKTCRHQPAIPEDAHR